MARAKAQTTALKMAYDEAMAALAKLKDNTDDATQEEVDDARAKLNTLKQKIAGAVDVSDEVKAMYPAEALNRTALRYDSGMTRWGTSRPRPAP